MGVGNPVELLEAISRGVDMFDSRFPTKNARHGTLFSSEGKVRLMRGEHVVDEGPLDKNCDCFVCKKYSRSHIRHLLKEEEPVGLRLATFHNLYYLQRLMEQAREAIKAGKFLEFKNRIKKVYAKTEDKVKKN